MSVRSGDSLRFGTAREVPKPVQKSAQFTEAQMSIPNRFMCVSRRPLGFVFELLAPRAISVRVYRHEYHARYL